MDHNFVTNSEINSTVYTYVLLDVLLCNIAEYLTSCAVFWRPRRASQNTNNESKFSAILQKKTANQKFIIQHAKVVCSLERISWIFIYRECVIEVCETERNWRGKSS